MKLFSSVTARGIVAAALAAFLPLSAMGQEEAERRRVDENIRVAVAIADRYGWADFAEEILRKTQSEHSLSGDQRDRIDLARLRIQVERLRRASDPAQKKELEQSVLDLWSDFQRKAPKDGRDLSYLRARLAVARLYRSQGEEGEPRGYEKALEHLRGIAATIFGWFELAANDPSLSQDLNVILNETSYEKAKLLTSYASTLPESDERREKYLREAEEEWFNMAWPYDDAWERGNRGPEVQIPRAVCHLGRGRALRHLERLEEAGESLATARDTLIGGTDEEGEAVLRETMTEMAEIAMVQGRPEPVFSEIERLLKRRSGKSRADWAFLLGSLYVRQGDRVREAEGDAKGDAWKSKAAALVKPIAEGEGEQAERAKVLLATWEGGGSPLLEEGNRLYGARRYAESRRTYRLAARLAPPSNRRDVSTEAYYRIGASYWEEKRYLEAASGFHLAYETDPEHPRAADAAAYWCTGLAVGLRELGEEFTGHRSLTEAYAEFVDRFPDHERTSGFAYDLGGRYYELRNYADAIRYYGAVKPSFEHHLDAVYRISLSRFRFWETLPPDQEDRREEVYRKAVEALDRFLDAAGKRKGVGKDLRRRKLMADATYRLAMLHIRSAEAKKGLERLSRFETEFSGPDFQDYLGRLHVWCLEAHVQLGDLDRAVEAFREIDRVERAGSPLWIQARRTLQDLYRSRAQAMREKGGEDQARTYENRILELEDELRRYVKRSPERDAGLIRRYFDQRNDEGVIRLAREFLKEYGDRTEENIQDLLLLVRQWLAGSLYRTQQWKEALEAYEALDGIYEQRQQVYLLFKDRIAQCAWEAAREAKEEGERESLFGKALVAYTNLKQRFQTPQNEEQEQRWWKYAYNRIAIFAEMGDEMTAVRQMVSVFISRPNLGGENWKPKFVELVDRLAVSSTPEVRDGAKSLKETIRNREQEGQTNE